MRLETKFNDKGKEIEIQIMEILSPLNTKSYFRTCKVWKWKSKKTKGTWDFEKWHRPFTKMK